VAIVLNKPKHYQTNVNYLPVKRLKYSCYHHKIPYSLKNTSVASKINKKFYSIFLYAKIAIQKINRDKAIKYISKAIKLHNESSLLYQLNNVISSLNTPSSYLPNSLPLLEQAEERLKFTINLRKGK